MALKRAKLPLLVVFIPALNEAEQITQVIASVRKHYSKEREQGFRVELIVVDDGSTDDTAALARRAGADKVISHPQNLGLGAATRTGMRYARDLGADVAIKLDADFQHDPVDIGNTVGPILEDRADIVFGSRFAGKIHYRMPIIRYVGNRVFTRLMRFLTGWNISDAQTGLMAYSKKYLAVFSMPGDYNPPQQTLIDAFHKHMRYTEVPVTFHRRTTGTSFVSLKYPFKVAVQIIRMIMITAPLKIFLPLGLTSSVLGVALGAVEVALYLTGRLNDMHDGTILVLITFGVQALFFGFVADLIIQSKD